MDEMEPISDAAKRIVDELAGTEHRTPTYDPDQLAEETRRFRFSEAYMTEYDYHKHLYATVSGHRQRIHSTSYFARFFGIYDDLRSGQPPTDGIAQAYDQEAASRHYEQIFTEFDRRFPNLYLKILEVSKEVEEEAQLRKSNPEQANELTETAYYGPRREDQAYYSSCAYLGMASIARTLDPGYNLKYLYQPG